MRCLLMLAAVVVGLSAAACAQESDHIDPATVVHPCSKKNPPPCATTAPKVLKSPDPEVPSQLRDYHGVVVLFLIVGTDGRAHNIAVARSLQPDLDKEAMKAVSKWKFKPATDHGKPVPVAIDIEVNFGQY